MSVPVHPEDWAALPVETLERWRGEIQAELDRRAGKPTEHAVRGDLLIGFDAAWPAGLFWKDEAMWNYEEDDSPIIDPGRIYDLRGQWLVDDVTNKEVALWDAFSEWYEKRRKS